MSWIPLENDASQNLYISNVFGELNPMWYSQHTKTMPNLRYGIRYLNSTRISGIQDITVFNLLKSLTSGRIKLSKMRLELGSHTNEYLILRKLRFMHVMLLLWLCCEYLVLFILFRC